jgi:hypothetical protein
LSYLFRFSGFVVALAALLLVQVNAAYAQCANPVGAAGDLTYNDSEYVMQWCDGTNWNGVGKSPYIPNAVKFDGSATALHTLMNGQLGGKELTFSAWFRRNSLGSNQNLYANGAYGIIFYVSNSIGIKLASSSTPDIILASTATQINDYNWHHLIISLDTSNASNRAIYIDGVLDATTWNAYIIDSLINDSLRKNIGARGTGSSRFFNGDMADVWMNDTYVDLSVAANRAQFIDASGWPVDLGTDGSKATGAVPDIYLTGATAAWHTNKGTGGGFTENGALTDAITNPGANMGPAGGLICAFRAHPPSDSDLIRPPIPI